MVFIIGSDDWITPMEMARDYYTSLENKNKHFFIMNGMGHILFVDDPIQFSENVKASGITHY
jgi:pimeloyl-ACP methyl ester carboxylesterase